MKQADLVLAMHVCDECFTPEQKARNFAYYERLTVRDSSLSACTQAVIAAEVGHAVQPLREALIEAAPQLRRIAGPIAEIIAAELAQRSGSVPAPAPEAEPAPTVEHPA